MPRKKTHWTVWFWAKVEMTDNHWLWCGAHLKGGYGQFTSAKKDIQFESTLAHRIAYQLLIEKPKGELHHICGNPSCVNPVHLLDVSRREHAQLDQRHLRQRVEKEWIPHPDAKWRLDEMCPNNHKYSEIGWYVYPDGRRSCRECRRQAGQRYRDRLKREDI